MFKFVDNRATVYGEINRKIQNHVEEVKSLLSSQASKNTKRETGRLSDSFTTDSLVEVGKDEITAYIGSSVEYAPYYEMGTGEYALMGNGRQTPWVYYDPIQKRYFKTTGQTPKRPLYHAYQQNKSLIQNRANEVLR